MTMKSLGELAKLLDCLRDEASMLPCTRGELADDFAEVLDALKKMDYAAQVLIGHSALSVRQVGKSIQSIVRGGEELHNTQLTIDSLALKCVEQAGKGNKIQAIKALRDAWHTEHGELMGLYEAKCAVDEAHKHLFPYDHGYMIAT